MRPSSVRIASRGTQQHVGLGGGQDLHLGEDTRLETVVGIGHPHLHQVGARRRIDRVAHRPTRSWQSARQRLRRESAPRRPPAPAPIDFPGWRRALRAPPFPAGRRRWSAAAPAPSSPRRRGAPRPSRRTARARRSARGCSEPAPPLPRACRSPARATSSAVAMRSISCSGDHLLAAQCRARTRSASSCRRSARATSTPAVACRSAIS